MCSAVCDAKFGPHRGVPIGEPALDAAAMRGAIRKEGVARGAAGKYSMQPRSLKGSPQTVASNEFAGTGYAKCALHSLRSGALAYHLLCRFGLSFMTRMGRSESDAAVDTRHGVPVGE